MSDKTEEYIEKQKKKLIIAGAILGGIVLILIIAWIIVTINSPKHMITMDGFNSKEEPVAVEDKSKKEEKDISEGTTGARSEMPREKQEEPKNTAIEARGEVPKTGATDEYFLTAVLIGASVFLTTRLILSKKKPQEVEV